MTRSPVGTVETIGTVTIINENTLRVSNFRYTGSGGGAVEFRLSPLQNEVFYAPNRIQAATNAFNQITANDGFTDGFREVAPGVFRNDPRSADGIDDFPASDFAVNVGGPATLRGTAPDPNSPLIELNQTGPIAAGINPEFPDATMSPDFPDRFIAGDDGDVLFDNVSFDIDLSDAAFVPRGDITGSGDPTLSNVFDFGGISVWCDPFNLDFGSGQFRSPEEIGILMGDFNDDGEVNAADFTVWRDELGRDDVTPFTNGDGDGDGDVDIDDFLVYQDNFGATAAAVSSLVAAAQSALTQDNVDDALADLERLGFDSSNPLFTDLANALSAEVAIAAVPEPTTAVLVAIGFAVARGRRRDRLA